VSSIAVAFLSFGCRRTVYASHHQDVRTKDRRHGSADAKHSRQAPAAAGSKFDEKEIDWEVVGVVLFIFTLFPFVWFYRELIQQTYEIRRNHGKDR